MQALHAWSAWRPRTYPCMGLGRTSWPGRPQGGRGWAFAVGWSVDDVAMAVGPVPHGGGGMTEAARMPLSCGMAARMVSRKQRSLAG